MTLSSNKNVTTAILAQSRASRSEQALASAR